jgi:hypothetical protein
MLVFVNCDRIVPLFQGFCDASLRIGLLFLKPLPFAHLNLRRNPFGEFSADERTPLAQVDLESALQHLHPAAKSSRPVVQFLGEKGFGKTTHLLAIASRFPESAYLHIPEGEYRPIPNEGEPLLIDEAQRLTLWQRIRLFRSTRTLVLGTHRDFAGQLERVGRSVLTLAANRDTDAARVSAILNARIVAVRRTDGPTPRITQATATRLFSQFGSDVRSMQHSLYEIFQQLRSIQDV